jgi:hypothetical protein
VEEDEDEDVEDEASVVEEQRVDDALEVSTATDVTVTSSYYDIDRLKALAAEIAVSPEPPAARGRRAEGGRASRASWAKIRTIQRFTDDGVNHPRYVLHQSSEEEDGD